MYGDGVRTRHLYDSGQAIHQPLHPLCYEFFFRLACAYNILDVVKCMYYSKNSELKITLLLVNIIVNTECQHSQKTLQDFFPPLSICAVGKTRFSFFLFFSFFSFFFLFLFVCFLPGCVAQSVTFLATDGT